MGDPRRDETRGIGTPNLARIAVLLALPLVGCSDGEESTYTCEEIGGRFECTSDETGEACADPEDPGCSCECVIDEPECEPACGPGGRCSAGRCVPSYHFVKIEDLSAPDESEFPGADIDAIVVSKGGGGMAAQAVESWQTTRTGYWAASDPTAVLGAADVACGAGTGWLSLGGAGSYVVVDTGILFDETYQISVVEVGGSACPGTPMAADDGGVSVRVSVSSDAVEFVEVGECAGSCTLSVLTR